LVGGNGSLSFCEDRTWKKQSKEVCIDHTKRYTAGLRNGYRVQRYLIISEYVIQAIGCMYPPYIFNDQTNFCILSSKFSGYI
jgi:hypothetical protein